MFHFWFPLFGCCSSCRAYALVAFDELGCLVWRSPSIIPTLQNLFQFIIQLGNKFGRQDMMKDDNPSVQKDSTFLAGITRGILLHSLAKDNEIDIT